MSQPPGGPDTAERRWRWAAAALLAGAGLVALATFLHYGLTYDEEVQRDYAEAILRWATSGGKAKEALRSGNLHLYGGLFEVPAQLVGRVFPSGVYEGRHLVNVLFGLLGVWGTFKLGALLGGARTGFLAALFLLLNPVYYGHSFNNPKDIPFAAMSVWALWAMFRASMHGPRIPWTEAVRTGLMLGLPLAIRAGGIFHFGYVGLLWGGGWVLHHARVRQGWRPFGRDAVRLIASLAVVLTLAWLVMLSCWPYGQFRPFAYPVHAIQEATRFQWDGLVLFNGQMISSVRAPWTYLPGYFAVSLPEFYFLGLGAALVMAVRALRSAGLSSQGVLRWGMLVFVVLFPPVMAILLSSTLYDGLRHFLFLMPPLAILAAKGISELLDASRPTVVRAATACLVTALVTWVVVDMVQLHPYQSVYFNRLVAGGLKGADGRFETDYWGNSYREAVEWVLENYRPDPPRKVLIGNCSTPHLSNYFVEKEAALADRFGTAEGKPGNSDIFIATTREQCHRRTDRLLHVVERQGVGLAYVFELHP